MIRTFSAPSRIAFTCDDLSPGTKIDVLKRLLSIIDKRDITVTFFAIPKSAKALNFQGSLARTIRDAHSCGHEVGLHGLHHTFFEMGIRYRPFDLNYPLVCDRIFRGLGVFREELDLKPLGFRAPHYQYGQTLLRVLNDLGFLYDSSEIPLTNLIFSYFPPLRSVLVPFSGKPLRVIRSEAYHPLGLRLLEIPVTWEYTWYNQKFGAKPLIDLLENDIDQMEANAFVINSHIGSLSLRGLEILKDLFSHVRDMGFSRLDLRQMASRTSEVNVAIQDKRRRLK